MLGVAIKHDERNAIFVLGPHGGRALQSINGLKNRKTETVGGKVASVLVPVEGLRELRLRIRTDADLEPGHIELSRERASRQALAPNRPARNASRLSNSS